MAEDILVADNLHFPIDIYIEIWYTIRVNKTNNKLIVFNLGVLVIMAFSLVTTKQASAFGYYGGTAVDTYQPQTYYNAPVNNPCQL